MKETYRAILQKLDNANITYQLHEHPPIVSARDLDESLPFPLDNLLKTVGFRIKNRGFVRASVQGFDRIDIDMPALASLSSATIASISK